MAMTDSEVLGPISYLVVEFPKVKVTGEGLKELVDLVERGLVRVLDLAFIVKDMDGSVQAVDIRDLDGDGQLDLTVFEGSSSGLLDADDIAEGGEILRPGSAAAILVYENRWATSFVSAIRRNGAQLIAAGFIPQDTVVASLDALERADS
jgi:hypothetical protein